MLGAIEECPISSWGTRLLFSSRHQFLITKENRFRATFRIPLREVCGVDSMRFAPMSVAWAPNRLFGPLTKCVCAIALEDGLKQGFRAVFKDDWMDTDDSYSLLIRMKPLLVENLTCNHFWNIYRYRVLEDWMLELSVWEEGLKLFYPGGDLDGGLWRI